MRTYSKKKIISDVSLKMPMKEYLEDSSAKSFKDTMTELEEKKKALEYLMFLKNMMSVLIR